MDKDEDRIQLRAKVHYYDDKIIDEEKVLIDCKNNLIWINDELNYCATLEKVLRELIIIPNAKEDETKWEEE